MEKKSVRFLSNSNESHSEHVVRSAYADVKIPNVPLHEFVFENLGQHEDKTAIVSVLRLFEQIINELFVPAVILSLT